MRHAYLIIVHNQFNILIKLVKLLDHKDNDIYIHIDSKADLRSFSKEDCIKQVNFSKITFVPSMSVCWGGDSQIICELRLLEYAAQNHYDYYHLLSGVCLPLKTQNQIHEFFEKNQGTEFVHFDTKVPNNNSERYNYYYFQNYKIPFIKRINRLVFLFQEKFSLVRKDRQYNHYKGANWFSITDKLAQYVVSQKDNILKEYKYTWCCDEVFLQTLVMNSEFCNNLTECAFDNDYHSCLRYIDWNRGKPYTFTSDDFEELINSDYLFARKFTSNNNEKLPDMIYDYLMKKQQPGK